MLSGFFHQVYNLIIISGLEIYSDFILYDLFTVLLHATGRGDRGRVEQRQCQPVLTLKRLFSKQISTGGPPAE